MNILLMNKNDDVVATYLPNHSDFEQGDVVSIFGKDSEVLEIEKYTKLGAGEHVTLVLVK